MTGARVARPDPAFWAGKRVLVTGHSGFKGAWATLWLARMGAEVTGISLPPESDRALFARVDMAARCRSWFCDIRDRAILGTFVADADPQIVLHMAAQPLVRRSVADPLLTFSSNVMGTANLLDALRGARDLSVVLAVTSDKVYANSDRGEAFGEDAALGGHDPYSGSKAATEHVAHSFDMTYFRPRGVRLATARAGNVIGGGDAAEDRIIPDCVRALEAGTPLVLRHPEAVRPWQHVLDCLSGYLLYAEHLAGAGVGAAPRALNFGPEASDMLPVGEVVELFYAGYGTRADVRVERPERSIEMKTLMLDPAEALRILGWRCSLGQRDAVVWTADWYRRVAETGDALAATLDQIDAFTAG
ncbi:CDP-glucose 4,6-dehydratase [Polymorphum gilvum]|uniref:CDP-glucose 4,6-dehydratase protein n=1 Tax=Polymorphum gilvum (strain LMG 25793 / CGMCC 1.9160 / SL003B-26A1) TaxID=991905 RepID=F2IVH3_POLGS|nr:CDP-glucose 4,6-dehydratase [Polymorphum gilvum]ADZ72691.1 CDP-glucose 4,6-dehydratase protein [Polymorphum gilvum SL003B-26A1]